MRNKIKKAEELEFPLCIEKKRVSAEKDNARSDDASTFWGDKRNQLMENVTGDFRCKNKNSRDTV